MSSYIGLIEARDRRVRITVSGMEITTTFYVEPATAAPAIVSCLIGRTSGSNPNAYARMLPAADFEYPFCFCVEARPAPMDARAAVNSASLLKLKIGAPITTQQIQAALRQPINFNGPQTIGSTHPTEAAPGQCGAYIEAVYRPLPTIYREDGKTQANWEHPENAFDYLDPQFYPCSASIPISESLFILQAAVKGSYGAKAGGAPQRTETWQEITIRRAMCPSVPWDTIRQLQNRINGVTAWTPANMTVPGLPANTFVKGTLRFDSAEPIKRTLPSAWDANNQAVVTKDADGNSYWTTTGMTWWDITYKFSWRTTVDWWFNAAGKKQGPSQLTWNCVWFDGSGIVGAINSPILGSWSTAWYESGYWAFSSNLPVGAGFYREPKYLNAEDSDLPINANPAGLPKGATHPFDALFLNNAS